jgi:hypothetical protein
MKRVVESAELRGRAGCCRQNISVSWSLWIARSSSNPAPTRIAAPVALRSMLTQINQDDVGYYRQEAADAEQRRLAKEQNTAPPI